MATLVHGCALALERRGLDLVDRRLARLELLALLDELGIDDYFFELFDGTHAGIEYRYPLAVKYLAEKLGA